MSGFRITNHPGVSGRVLGLFMALCATVLLLSACGPDYPDCETDEHCASDRTPGGDVEYCLNQKCAQCRQNSHCSEGDQCVAGACEQIVGWCKGNDMCVGKEKCRNNRCGPECVSDSDCDSGTVCKADGTCQIQCVVDADCPAGEQCSGGRCFASTAGAGGKCDSLSPVYFDFNEYSLRSDARESLREHAECAKNRSQAIQIEGHCDERGTPEYNIALGERRARSARDYMISLGVARNKLSMISYGEERPNKRGGGESTWSLNRRCEFGWR